jgi:hypothetical protein
VLAARGDAVVPSEAIDLSPPEVSGEDGGVGIGRGAGTALTEPGEEAGADPPPAGGAERGSGMNELPSAGGVGGLGGTDVEDGAVAGIEDGSGAAGDAGGVGVGIIGGIEIVGDEPAPDAGTGLIVAAGVAGVAGVGGAVRLAAGAGTGAGTEAGEIDGGGDRSGIFSPPAGAGVLELSFSFTWRSGGVFVVEGVIG